MKELIRVLVVDDSPFVCDLLARHLRSAPDLRVVGMAYDGEQAIRIIEELRPDAITLDLDMPGIGGLATLEAIMHRFPTPIVIVSGVSIRAAEAALRAINTGAVDFVFKYSPGEDTDPEILRRDIVTKVRAAARIKVVRSLRGGRRLLDEQMPPAPASLKTAPHAADVFHSRRAWEEAATALPPLLGVVVIGASTGGPIALRELLSNLPPDFPVPIVVVQHMPATFTPVLAAQLNRQVSLHVREAVEGDLLQPGVALIAPGNKHLVFRPSHRVGTNQHPAVGGHRPSVDVTMQSAARLYGGTVRGVILTGMGSDGALGIAEIYARGGATFAQDAASCVVNGMPQRAIEKGVVDYVAPPIRIAHLLCANLARTYRQAFAL